MVFTEGGVIPGLYFQANNDNPVGVSKDYKPMESMVPAGAIIPEDTAPPETQVAQVDLDKVVEARGKLIEMLG